MVVSESKIRAYTLSGLAFLGSIGCLVGLGASDSPYLKTLFLAGGSLSSMAGLHSQKQIEYEESFDPILNRIEWENRMRGIKGGYNPKAVEDDPSLVLPPDGWLGELVLESNHFRCNGETGSGKSVFSDNLTTLAKQALGGKTKTILIDPKYPLSDWEITPNYKGIEEAMNGLERLSKEVESRLAMARESKEANGNIGSFSPILFIIDEIDWVISEYEKEAVKHLKVGLKVGRALNIKVLYLGQTPLCSDLKMRKNDFKHSCNFFLGENILAGINEVAHTANQKRELRTQYGLWVEQGEKYLALVKPVGRSAFIAPLPKPKAYSEMRRNGNALMATIEPQNEVQPQQQTQSEAQWLEGLYTKDCAEQTHSHNEPQTPQNEPICPKCGSSEFKKNGKYRGRDRFQCKVCKKTWSN